MSSWWANLWQVKDSSHYLAVYVMTSCQVPLWLKRDKWLTCEVNHTHKHFFFFLAFNLSCVSTRERLSCTPLLFFTCNLVAIVIHFALEISLPWKTLVSIYCAPTLCAARLQGFWPLHVHTVHAPASVGTPDLILTLGFFWNSQCWGLWVMRRRQRDADGLGEKQHLVNKSQTSKTRKNFSVRGYDRRCSAWLIGSKFCKISFQFQLEL